MEKNMQFASDVMLIDTSYLDRVVSDMRRHFTSVLGRELPKADLAVLLECLALDGGVQTGKNEVQVLLIHESSDSVLHACMPSDYEAEIHGKAFAGRLGEFALYAFQPAEMASRETLFMEALGMALSSKEVGRLLVVPDETGYGKQALSAINAAEEKKSITLFGMNPPAGKNRCGFDLLGFSVLQALGIRADELK